jgi:hypothetical protein
MFIAERNILMIARIWRGVTPAAQADSYLEYMNKTGLSEYREKEGNRGVFVLREIRDDRAEFIVLSLWESLEAVKTFAGDEIEIPVYYPEDDEYLLWREPNVAHYEVVANS